MKWVKRIFKLLFGLLLLVVLYFVGALVCTYIPVNEKQIGDSTTKEIYLSTNGVHLDIVIPTNLLSADLANGIITDTNARYYSFGWGDENFYINTPTWDDLTFGNAVNALFFTSSTLMHVTAHKNERKNWKRVALNSNQLVKVNKQIASAFQINKLNIKIPLIGKGYNSNDTFYKANGSYSCFNTCNSWVNSVFKESGLRACFWTPFDFGLLGEYE